MLVMWYFERTVWYQNQVILSYSSDIRTVGRVATTWKNLEFSWHVFQTWKTHGILKSIQKTWKTPGILKFDIPGFSRSDFQIIFCNIDIRKKFSRLRRSYFYNLHKHKVWCRVPFGRRKLNLTIKSCRPSGFYATSPCRPLSIRFVKLIFKPS